LKKSCVDPLSRVPYCISVCFARSSAFSIGVSMRSTVRNAARLAVYGTQSVCPAMRLNGNCVSVCVCVRACTRLAVYVEMMMSVKNHQALPTIRPGSDLSLTTNQSPAARSAS